MQHACACAHACVCAFVHVWHVCMSACMRLRVCSCACILYLLCDATNSCHDCATCAACGGLRHATASSIPMRATSATRVTVRALARTGLCAGARVCVCVQVRRKRAGALACMHAPVFAWCAHVCRWGCVLVRSCARGHVRARAYCAAQGPPEDCIEPECCTVPPHPHTYGLLYAPGYPSGSGGGSKRRSAARMVP